MRGGYLAVLALLGSAPAGIPAVVSVTLVAGFASARAEAAERTVPAATANPAMRTAALDAAATPAGTRALPTSFDYGPLPAELLAPVPHCPTGMRAPSDAAWVRSTMRLSYYSEGFVYGLRPGIEPETFTERQAFIAKQPARPRVAAPKPGERVRLAMAATAPLPPLRPTRGEPEIKVEQAAVSEALIPEAAAAPIDERPLTARQRRSADRGPPEIEALISRHAARFSVPERLVRRVVWRESRYNPKARNGPYWGLMQISVATARGLGFRGAPADLLDADTNMTYAVAYLANAYKVAGRNEDRAVSLYARGYYYEAKRKGLLGDLIRTASAR